MECDRSCAGGAAATRFPSGVPRYTLTAFGDRVYARMGPTNWPSFSMRGISNYESRSSIVAVDRATEGKLLWKRPATEIVLPKRQAEAANRTTGFEGTPVADARNVYAAMTERKEQTSTYVVCFDAETAPRGGSATWGLRRMPITTWAWAASAWGWSLRLPTSATRS